MKRDLAKATALVVILSLVGIPVLASSSADDPVVLDAWMTEFGVQSLKRGATPVNNTTLPPGSYVVKGPDHSPLHNYHLVGPDTNKSTGVEEVHVEFEAHISKPGVYELYCDEEPDTRIRFTIAAPATSTTSTATTSTGSDSTATITTTTETTTQTTSTTTTTSPPPPSGAKPKPITGWVSPTGIGLRQNGKKILMLSAGSYKLTVDDRSRRENFHLTGPKLDRKTGKAFKGKVTWQLVLKKNNFYRFRSDARPMKLKGFVHAH